MISDTEARRIASEWHGGGGTALYAFASTGAINTARPDHDIQDEINDCVRQCKIVISHDPAEREIPRQQANELHDLRLYILEHGTRGPQSGWNDLTW